MQMVRLVSPEQQRGAGAHLSCRNEGGRELRARQSATHRDPPIRGGTEVVDLVVFERVAREDCPRLLWRHSSLLLLSRPSAARRRRRVPESEEKRGRRRRCPSTNVQKNNNPPPTTKTKTCSLAPHAPRACPRAPDRARGAPLFSRAKSDERFLSRSFGQRWPRWRLCARSRRCCGTATSARWSGGRCSLRSPQVRSIAQNSRETRELAQRRRPLRQFARTPPDAPSTPRPPPNTKQASSGRCSGTRWRSTRPSTSCATSSASSSSNRGGEEDEQEQEPPPPPPSFPRLTTQRPRPPPLTPTTPHGATTGCAPRASAPTLLSSAPLSPTGGLPPWTVAPSSLPPHAPRPPPQSSPRLYSTK